jgi:hypothetical protein
MWRVNTWSANNIERVECSKVTAKCVFVIAEQTRSGKMYRFEKPQRESMSSSYRSYYKTWAEAYQALLARVEAEVTRARRHLARLYGDYGRIKGMKPPEAES